MMVGGCGLEGSKGERKWDNCTSIINKIYLKQDKEGGLNVEGGGVGRARRVIGEKWKQL